MHSAAELLRRIPLGEDSSLELYEVRFSGSKLAAPSRDDLADEIAAMANSGGGMLVLGVRDQQREILGIPSGHTATVERFIIELSSDSIKPPVGLQTHFLELSDSAGNMRAVLQVEIPQSSFVHESPGGYFYRQGSHKRKLPPAALARLMQQRRGAGLIAFDEAPVPGTGAADLDEALYRPLLRSSSGDLLRDLHKLRLLAKDEGGEDRATAAGVLMGASKPERWFPNALIEAVRYRGNRRDSNYQLDARTITGPLNEQVLQALSFARRNMSVAARKAPAREEIPQYSARALFEAIVNAVTHRDYSIHGAKIRMFLFADRLELYSPGNLPNTLTVENIAMRQFTRNQLIASLLSWCPVGDAAGDVRRRYFLERRGEGVPIIMEESRALSGHEPRYRLIDDAELLLTVRAAAPESPPAS